MQENRNSLALLIPHGVGLLLLLLSTFLGLNYLMGGNRLYAGIATLFVVLLAYLLVFGLQRVKTKMFNTGFTLPEGILLTSYLVVALASLVVMVHYYNVEFLLKDQIKSSGLGKLEEMRNMNIAYQGQVESNLNLTDRALQNTLKTYLATENRLRLRKDLGQYRSSLSPTIRDESASPNEVAEATRLLKANIFETDSIAVMGPLKEVEQKTQSFDQQHNPILNQWRSDQLQFTFFELQKQLEAQRDSLSALWQRSVPPYWEDKTFEFPISKAQENYLNSPFKLFGAYSINWWIPILLALAVHFLILSPYVFSARSIYIKHRVDGDSQGVAI